VAARDAHASSPTATATIDGSQSCSSVLSPLPVVVPVAPVLALICVDDHFAPNVETLNASYTTLHLAADTVTVTITGTNYGGNVVFQANVPSGDGVHALGWRGQVNQGALNGGYVTPLHSPYTITVAAATANITQSVQFKVFYREITLALGTWTADGNPPVEATHQQAWVQYKLNELGYFGGPVSDNIAADSTAHRAMIRYARAHPGLDHLDPLARQSENYHNSVAFRGFLRANAHPRTTLQGGALPDAGLKTRVYIDHPYYYYDLNAFGVANGNVLLDRKYLDPFELPVEATITLMSQNDANGTGAGVVSPQAVGEVKVQWVASEQPENVSGMLPNSTLTRPTRARKYLNAALTATAEGGTNRDNCPAALGGSRQDGGNANRAHFYIGGDLPPYTSTNTNDDVFTTTYQGAVAGKCGKAGIIFRGSYIAGDNFSLRAQISFDSLPNQAALKAAHVTVFQAASFDDLLLHQTGQMEVWRRHNVAAVINWPAPAVGPIAWADVAAEYEYAYCELVSGGIVTMTGAHFVANDLAAHPLGGVLPALLNPHLGEMITFAGGSLFPLTIPAQQGSETAREYKARLNSDLKAKISEPMLQTFADAVGTIISSQHLPGATVIHAKWVGTINLQHKSLWGYGENKNVEAWDPALFCIGLTGGVAIISNQMYPNYDDRFIIAHEMGHSRFLRHHETGSDPQLDTVGRINNASDNPGDHDLRDHNCTMCYPFGIPTRRDLQWDRTGANRPGFCGKCLLKLRGWNVSDALLPRESAL
jgi:hypothetical protein